MKTMHLMETMAQRSPTLAPLDAKKADLAFFLVHCATPLLVDQTVTTTALVLLQRTIALRRKDQCVCLICSPDAYADNRFLVGACLLLATKVCEAPRSVRSVVNVLHAAMFDSAEPLGTGSRYADIKSCLINAEQTVLRALQFDVEVMLPFQFVLRYADALGFSNATAHCAVQLATDVHFDSRALDLPPPVLAAACLRLASVFMEDHAPGAAKWWYTHDTSDEDIATTATILQRVYGYIDAIAFKGTVGNGDLSSNAATTQA